MSIDEILEAIKSAATYQKPSAPNSIIISENMYDYFVKIINENQSYDRLRGDAV